MKDIEKTEDEEIEELNKRGKKRVVNYRAILSSCKSVISRSGGLLPARRSRRAGHPTEPVKEKK